MAPRGDQSLSVAAIRLPRISNSTDIEALACEPGVVVRWVADAADLAGADVVVIPGSKSTVTDLRWLRERGLAAGIAAHAAAGRAVLGVCGGFQMLCRQIDDPVESRAGRTEGLGLLDADIVFAEQKTLRHWETPLRGYEIHHGQVVRATDADWLGIGLRRDAVYGTHWHGLLDNDELRRAWLAEVAAAAGRDGFVVADDVDVTARRDAQLDLMADLIADHLDVGAVLDLLEHGAPRRPVMSTTLQR
jgi:adenosylcobyric acid synthase